MTLLKSYRFRRLVLFASLGVVALFTVIRITEYEATPWGWMAAVAVGTALLFGPVTWAVRDRIPKERRERLSYVSAGVVLLCVPILLGVGLIVGGLLFFLDVIVLGSIIGLVVASLVEGTVVPDRLRGATR